MDTIVARLLDFARRDSDALAFIERGQRLTYEGLARRVQATAAWLAGAGVRAGDTVALSFGTPLADSIRSLQLLYALAHLGAVTLPLYPGVPMARRLELVAQFRARWLISSDTSEAAADCSRIDPAACDWRASERAGVTAPRGDASGRPFLYQFSGGTTGESKVVLFTHAQFVANMTVGAVAINARASDRLMSSRPWPHLPGLRYLLRIHCVGGAFVNDVFPETPQELGRLIERTGTTILFASPWQLRRLLSTPRAERRGAVSLRALSVGGAFVAPHEIEAARKTITPNVYVSYATTEAGVIAQLGPDDPVGASGDVGPLVEGMEAHAVDDQFDVLPPGAVGLLGFRASWIPDRYVDNDRATAESFHEGWFYPGDLGTIDAGRRISLHGRRDDVINFGGLKIRPQDVEPILLEHPDIEDAAVVAMPHPMAGQMPVALVVLRRPVAGESLMRFLRSRIDEGRLPVSFVEVPEIFRSPDGKILRHRLLAEYGTPARRST